MNGLVINPGMTAIDWGFVIGLIVILFGILIYCRRFLHNSADFLVANRCASRYILCISSGIAGFAVVNSVATWEMFYESGFSATWWEMLSTPIALALSLVAWVTYRFRETRCFTMAQFFEIRYSRRFRVASGIIMWISGVVNYGIFPAVSVRFFMFFCRLPEKFMLFGVNWDVYAVLLFICIGMGVIFACGGGQIGIMVTDFFQGTMCNICFIIFIFFIFNLGKYDIFGGYVSWDQISKSLSTADGVSQINPFKCENLPDFNIWYFLIGIVSSFYNRGSWQGGMGYAAAAKNPHESKMAGILGSWRGMAQTLMIMLFPLAVIAIMKHPDFTNLAEAVKEQMANVTDPQYRSQGLVPTVLSMIMPQGLLGIFAAVMFAAMLSTDDTYIHSWGSIFIQDVIMPFRKKPFTPKQHIWALRLSIIFVGIFAWFFSYFFRQTENVFMFFAITGAIVSGAGAVIIGGLYWKRGGTIAAWFAYIGGAVIAITGIILQQTWKLPGGGGLAEWLYENFKWEWVANHMDRFPVNGQYITFIGMSSCILLYVVISLIEHYVFRKPDFNLEKLLHRGKYDTEKEHQEQSKVSILAQRLGITPEFSKADKILYAVTIGWTLVWLVIFIWYSTQYFLFGTISGDKWTPGVPDSMWMSLWHYRVYITLVLALVTTVWFLLGGLRDVVRLFKALKDAKHDDADNGSVASSENAGKN